MRDLTDASAEEVAAERTTVATEGWGAQLLALHGADGSWAGTAWNHGWNSTMHVLSLLRELGLDPASEEARRAVGQVHDHVRWITYRRKDAFEKVDAEVSGAVQRDRGLTENGIYLLTRVISYLAI